PAEGVRAARGVARQRRPGPDEGDDHRPRLGPALRGRHQDPRRPHQAPARQDRARSVPALPHHDDPRPRVPLREAPIVARYAADPKLTSRHPIANATRTKTPTLASAANPPSRSAPAVLIQTSDASRTAPIRSTGPARR